jgi:predicted nucleotidyltransferase
MKTIDDLKTLLIQTFPDDKIYLFGSRAKKTESVYSDIDIAIESTQDIRQKLSHLKYIIEESNLIQKVDLVNLAKAPYLKKIVHNEGLVWH